MTSLARPRASHGLNDEIARFESAVQANPDDYAASQRLNLLRLRHPERVPSGMPRVLIGPCDAGTVWQATVRPWAVTVAFGYGDPAQSTLDFLWPRETRLTSARCSTSCRPDSLRMFCC